MFHVNRLLADYLHDTTNTISKENENRRSDIILFVCLIGCLRFSSMSFTYFKLSFSKLFRTDKGIKENYFAFLEGDGTKRLCFQVS